MVTVDWDAVISQKGPYLKASEICDLLLISEIEFYEKIGRALVPPNLRYNPDLFYSIDDVRRRSELLGLSSPYSKSSSADEIQKEDKEDKQSHRFELRKRIYEIMKSRLGKEKAIEDIDEPFDWIYNSPMNEWENMLYCFEQECYIESAENKWSAQATRDAKLLYDLLK